MIRLPVFLFLVQPTNLTGSRKSQFTNYASRFTGHWSRVTSHVVSPLPACGFFLLLFALLAQDGFS
jgi:hypothetical protein